MKQKVDHKFNSFASQAVRYLFKPSSKFFRKVFEFSRIKEAVGILVVISVLTMAMLPSSIAAVQTTIDKNQAKIEVEVEIIRTQRSIRLPIDSYRLTQGYHFLHQALDFAGVKGSPIYSVMEGKVEEVKHGHFGYGNFVVVNHGDGSKSLYAHLSKIGVTEGEAVTNESIVGLLGSTGWSTGPHLHFQLWIDNKLVNPKTFFEAYFGQKLASTR